MRHRFPQHAFALPEIDPFQHAVVVWSECDSLVLSRFSSFFLLYALTKFILHLWRLASMLPANSNELRTEEGEIRQDSSDTAKALRGRWRAVFSQFSINSFCDIIVH